MVRAVFLKYMVRTVKMQPEAARFQVLDGFPTELREQIRQSGRLEWLKVDAFGALLRALWEAVGEPGSVALWRNLFGDSLTMPLVRPLFQGSIRLFGKNPAALARRTPQAWELVTRQCGDISVTADSPNQLVCRAENLTPALRHESLLSMFYGGFQTWGDFAGREVKVNLLESQLTTGSLRFELSWEDPGE